MGPVQLGSRCSFRWVGPAQGGDVCYPFHVDAWRGSQEVSRAHAVPGEGRMPPRVCVVCVLFALKGV